MNHDCSRCAVRAAKIKARKAAFKPCSKCRKRYNALVAENARLRVEAKRAKAGEEAAWAEARMDHEKAREAESLRAESRRYHDAALVAARAWAACIEAEKLESLVEESGHRWHGNTVGEPMQEKAARLVAGGYLKPN